MSQFTDTRDEIFTDTPNDQRTVTISFFFPAELSDAVQLSPYLPEALTTNVETIMGIPVETYANVQVPVYRTLPVAEAQERYPVIIFSPGMGNLPQVYQRHAGKPPVLAVGMDRRWRDIAKTGKLNGTMKPTAMDHHPQVF